jgi:hypothetical protein
MTLEALMNRELDIYFHTDQKTHTEKKTIKIPCVSDLADNHWIARPHEK